MPNIKRPHSRIHLFELNEIGNNVKPTAVADSDMVFLWVRMAETKPEPSIPIKYPKDIKRKTKPASLWLRPRSVSMVGINGEKITLAVKLIKKIKTRRIKKGSWVLIAPKLVSVSAPVATFCKMVFKVKVSELVSGIIY